VLRASTDGSGVVLLGQYVRHRRCCKYEWNLARRLNMYLIGVLIEEGGTVGDLTSTWQLVSLATGKSHWQDPVMLPVACDELRYLD
jgi:hypothetical protein